MSKSVHRSKTTKKGQNRRAQHQKKTCVRDEDGNGKKSTRNQPEYYDEVKQSSTFSITPTAKAGLNSLSQTLSISMSELIEQIGRGIIKLIDE